MKKCILIAGLLAMAACGGAVPRDTSGCDYCLGAPLDEPVVSVGEPVVSCQCPTDKTRTLSFVLSEAGSCADIQGHWRSYVAAGCVVPN